MSGAPGISVSYHTVGEAANDLRNAAGAIERELDDLQKYVAQVTEKWHGEGQTAYQQVQKPWSDTTRDLGDKLRSIASLLDDSVDGYRDTDRRAARGFGN
ncbi:MULTISPECIES: WXG100 family type VII secretion target [Streptomycetaceae]|uniref:ESAT-6-like protein n=1 Tax=Streptantibioticus cattleyicolor (strain ATCC 35852 / DSM 46488 / JCM 4925 / NBRC 14057 / NRRL 8057) TaxID=1003195 RepID=F8JUN9_STREN|nr:WXG100 family type VII secretion target [Streptantibioticus cattleyicolor]AEW96868.1 hypothetical protein SCATT_44970 [Streptantibioticus cattleyicolor NRRL 8057 = DSM 46488]MYS61346.1 WXG100 family type VII secretion target [Streptomyces sp. SID5468]CCB77197.1 conserved protein of unknown function [Streptantibioticus cattleyicolor NRRL 8057 = DSM 46488]